MRIPLAVCVAFAFSALLFAQDQAQTADIIGVAPAIARLQSEPASSV